jgi:hypothetical protein
MMKFKALATAAAVLAASSAASAEQLAERVDRPFETVSSVVQRVESRDDYASHAAIHYNRDSRTYQVLYTAKDGSPKLVVIDATTGEEKR